MSQPFIILLEPRSAFSTTLNASMLLIGAARRASRPRSFHLCRSIPDRPRFIPFSNFFNFLFSNFFNFLLSQTLFIFEQHVSANGQHHFESNEHERFRPSIFSGLPLSAIRAQKCNMWPGTFPLLAA